MKIEHVALWVKDIEKIRSFYERYFHVRSSEKYHNPTKKLSSYFLSFQSGSRLEIMQMDAVAGHGLDPTKDYLGYTHIAISVGSKEKVDEITSILKQDGYKVLDGPRNTGDGYYESKVLDPENNTLEIAI